MVEAVLHLLQFVFDVASEALREGRADAPDVARIVQGIGCQRWIVHRITLVAVSVEGNDAEDSWRGRGSASGTSGSFGASRVETSLSAAVRTPASLLDWAVSIRPLSKALAALRKEIGRASCRERMCQHV